MNTKRKKAPHEPLAFNQEMVERARRIADESAGKRSASEAGISAEPGPIPTAPRCRRPDCPILDDQARINDLSEDLVRAMRKLRRDLDACNRCPAYESCPILMEFNAAVQTAIQEINDEWNRGE
jgi:hypothetical protein